MMKIYKAKRGWLIHCLMIGLLILPFLIFFLDKEAFLERPSIFLPLVGPLTLSIWIYFDTYYKIEEGKLVYRSAFLRGEIDVGNIREIIKGKTMWVGIKPALASKGLIIKYNRFDDVYLAPVNNEELIEDLLKLNDKIVISG